jgi:hypothetical protein
VPLAVFISSSKDTMSGTAAVIVDVICLSL